MIPLHGEIATHNIPHGILAGLWWVRKEEDGTRSIESCSKDTPRRIAVLDNEPTNQSEQFIRFNKDLAYLSEDDIVSISDSGDRLYVLWRNESDSNTILLTERCDNYCVMCSQPPKKKDDSYLLIQAMNLVSALQETNVKFPVVGITGGEPTLYGEGFVDLLRRFQIDLPNFNVHVLSNGRKFSDEKFCSAVGAVITDRVVFGIPIYGSIAEDHDAIVGADGAFVETILGIHNLVEMGALVEIRVVLQRALLGRINSLADFIARNLPGTVQVALMGLELMGFARSNFDEVWVDPLDYAAELRSATRLLAANACNPRIYNHQLCVLPAEIRHFAVSSISDWKREYDTVCESCAVQHQCGGFFASAIRGVSRGISTLSSLSDPGSFATTAQTTPSTVGENVTKPIRKLRVTSVPYN